MVGQSKLIALRRQGKRPIDGVLLQVGFVLRQPGDVGRNAVVSVSNGKDPEAFDLRCLHALPVLLVAEAWCDRQWLRRLVDRVSAFAPASLTVLRIGVDPQDPGSQYLPVDAFKVEAGKPVRCCEQTAFLRAAA